METGQKLANEQVQRLMQTGNKVFMQVAPDSDEQVQLPQGLEPGAGDSHTRAYFQALAKAHGVLEEVAEVKERHTKKRALTADEKKIAEKFQNIF